MRIHNCKKCDKNMVKGWVLFVTKWYCENKECELYDKPQDY